MRLTLRLWQVMLLAGLGLLALHDLRLVPGDFLDA